jgi:hypothetical protein
VGRVSIGWPLAGKVEDEDAVEATLRCGDEGGSDPFVVGVGLVGGEGVPVREVDGEAVEIAAFDLLGAFGAAGVDGEDAGGFREWRSAKMLSMWASVTSGRAFRRTMWRIISRLP